MAYTIGGNIDASDFNQLASQVNSVIGTGTGNFGYGFASQIPVAAASTVRAGEWFTLRDNIDDCAVHQDTSAITAASAVIPPASAFEIGDAIIAYDGDLGRHNLPRMASAIVVNKANIAGSQSVINGSQLVSLRTASWAASLIHQFTFTFSDGDSARAFFNTGGYVQIRGERTGGSSTPQNTDWDNILASALYIFGGSAYFDATASTGFIQRASFGGASAYSLNDWTVLERRVGAIGASAVRGSQGSTIEFQIQFNDDHVGGSDLVTGSIKSVVDLRVSTGRISASVGSLVTVTGLAAGS